MVAFGLAAAFPAEDEIGLLSDRGSRGGDGLAQASLESLMADRDSKMAQRYALSQREAQILSYLLRGCSTTAIRNELYIAKGTVDTYVQRIYKKCGVHSRQELVDLSRGNASSDVARSFGDGDQNPR